MLVVVLGLKLGLIPKSFRRSPSGFQFGPKVLGLLSGLLVSVVVLVLVFQKLLFGAGCIGFQLKPGGLVFTDGAGLLLSLGGGEALLGGGIVF